MNDMRRFTVGIENISLVVDEILNNNYKVWTFTGSLGAGKTTLVQEMLKRLGITVPIQSPTYTYVTAYDINNSMFPHSTRLYHFDLYRLTSLNDFYQSGFFEYIEESQALSFIEWPEIIKPLLVNNKINVQEIYIEYDVSKDKRLILFK